MRTETQVSLKPYNTFGMDAAAHQLITLETARDINLAIGKYPESLIIGGGSNILLTKPTYQVVLINRIKGIQVVEKTGDHVIISVGSGENWHQLVAWAISHGYGGLENLSLIPGTAGAAPIQNIGAYGVELKDVLHGIDYFRYNDLEYKFIPVDQCNFGYRDSIFKNEWKNKGFISRIYLRLTRRNHIIHTEYKALQALLNEKDTVHPTIKQISDAVIYIRQSKLPDWKQLGNAGSFFKNPVVPHSLFESIQREYKDVPSFPVNDSSIKIPAAWLIQQAGFKGKKIGAAGSYKHQPLVLVNYGSASAEDILRLKDEIQSAVREKFEIELTSEVTIL